MFFFLNTKYKKIIIPIISPGFILVLVFCSCDDGNFIIVVEELCIVSNCVAGALTIVDESPWSVVSTFQLYSVGFRLSTVAVHVFPSEVPVAEYFMLDIINLRLDTSSLVVAVNDCVLVSVTVPSAGNVCTVVT